MLFSSYYYYNNSYYYLLGVACTVQYCMLAADNGQCSIRFPCSIVTVIVYYYTSSNIVVSTALLFFAYRTIPNVCACWVFCNDQSIVAVVVTIEYMLRRADFRGRWQRRRVGWFCSPGYCSSRTNLVFAIMTRSTTFRFTSARGPKRQSWRSQCERPHFLRKINQKTSICSPSRYIVSYSLILRNQISMYSVELSVSDEYYFTIITTYIMMIVEVLYSSSYDAMRCDDIDEEVSLVLYNFSCTVRIKLSSISKWLQ